MKRLIPVAALVAALACVVAAPASASRMRVLGIQSPPDLTAGAPGDPCSVLDPRTGLASAFSNTMSGSLIGCWYTDTFNIVKETPNGAVRATGNENFVGCLDADVDGQCAGGDPHGSLALTYTFEGKFDPNGQEIRGRCQHLVVSGTGDFTGASGRIDFKDDVTNGTSAYRGHITLSDARQRARATAASAAVSAQRPGC
jgi:hypothetical protein